VLSPGNPKEEVYRCVEALEMSRYCPTTASGRSRSASTATAPCGTQLFALNAGQMLRIA